MSLTIDRFAATASGACKYPGLVQSFSDSMLLNQTTVVLPPESDSDTRSVFVSEGTLLQGRLPRRSLQPLLISANTVLMFLLNPANRNDPASTQVVHTATQII